MRPEIRVSTEFATSRSAHQVGVLVTLDGERVVRRPPINVALVLDRSGSMSGSPLAAAREAAKRFVGFLGPQDRLSVVTFDDEVATVFGPAPGGSPDAAHAIERIHSGGSTNLSAGWLQGLRHVKGDLVKGTNRVVLLTDGQANAGITDVDQLTRLAGGGSADGVSTTSIGFGAHFNEDLLTEMSRSGGGNYWYVENDDQMADVFAGEVEGLVALLAQQAEVEVRLVHPRAAGMTLMQEWPMTRTDEGGWLLRLGDVYASQPKSVGLRFHVEDVATLGEQRVAEVVVRADVVSDEGVTRRVVTLPVMATLDGQSRVEPVVEETFFRYAMAQARREATERADEGDIAAAELRISDAVRECRSRGDMPAAKEELDDLRRMLKRIKHREYDARDRKYLRSNAQAVMEGKERYTEQLRRGRRKDQ